MLQSQNRVAIAQTVAQTMLHPRTFFRYCRLCRCRVVGSIGNAEWTGVELRGVLLRAGAASSSTTMQRLSLSG
jgi:hypothetical protein